MSSRTDAIIADLENGNITNALDRLTAGCKTNPDRLVLRTAQLVTELESTNRTALTQKLMLRLIDNI